MSGKTKSILMGAVIVIATAILGFAAWLWYTARQIGPLLVLLLALAGCNPDPPQPTPTPSPTPTATPTPEPTPPVGCYAPRNDLGWQEWATPLPEHEVSVRGAQGVLGDVCGLEPEDSLERLAAQLRGAGYCAGRVDDAVFIRRSDDPQLWEEHSAVTYVTGCWLTDTYRGVWSHE